MTVVTGNPSNGADDPTVGTLAWTNPGNITSGNVSFATQQFGSSSDSVVDYSVKLVKSGVIQGNNNSNAQIFSSVIGFNIYGNRGDLWGLNLTPSDINDPNFGVVFACRGTVSGVQGHYIKGTGFNFSIPNNAVVNGISLAIGGFISGNGKTGTVINVGSMEIDIEYRYTMKSKNITGIFTAIAKTIS